MLNSRKLKEIDFDSLIGPDILRFISRIEELENNLQAETRHMDMASLEWSSTVSELKRAASNLSLEMKMTKSKISELKRDFMGLVGEFKLIMQPEDFSKIKNRVDNWPVENFVTKEEFAKIAREKLHSD